MEIQFANLIEYSPKAPGIYKMFDTEGILLYVGKARDLNARLKQYLDVSKLEPHKQIMRSLVARVEWEITPTESDALILEEKLIKTEKPKYNIMLTDGKMYPLLALTKHEFPRLLKFRGKISQKKDVFGPYPSVGALNEAIKLIQKVCKIRTCTDSFMNNRARPCLLHQIGRCSAPCTKQLSAISYQLSVNLARRILSGDTASVSKELSEQMQAASARQDYEAAAELRDKIAALSATGNRSKPGESFVPPLRGGSAQSAVGRASFSESFSALETWLGVKFDKVAVFDNSHLFGNNPVGSMIVVARGGFLKNEYRHFKLRDKTRAGNDIAMMEEFLIRGVLNSPPAGESAALVGAPVGGKIESEFLPPTASRRATLALCDSPAGGEFKTPRTLIIVDGGRAQWNIAKKVLGDPPSSAFTSFRCDYGAASAMVVGVVKGEVRDGDEHFILPDGSEDRSLAKDSELFLFLRRVRDEAHRFAITFHRRVRAKEFVGSALDEIDGIGAARKRALLHHFGGTRQIADATAANLAKAPGISKTVAQKIYQHFHPNN